MLTSRTRDSVQNVFAAKAKMIAEKTNVESRSAYSGSNYHSESTTFTLKKQQTFTQTKAAKYEGLTDLMTV